MHIYLIQSSLCPDPLLAKLCVLGVTHLGKDAEYLQIAGGSHVVMPGELGQKLLGLLGHGLVDVDTDADQAWDDVWVVHLGDVLDEVDGHGAQGFLRPL